MENANCGLAHRSKLEYESLDGPPIERSRSPLQFESKGAVNRQAAIAKMFRLRTGRALRILRMTVAALLLLSCARVIRPLAAWTTASPEVAVRCLQVTRNVVFEVSAGSAKLIRPAISQPRETLSAPAPTGSVLQPNQVRLFIRIWPELRRSLLHRILPSASDAGH